MTREEAIAFAKDWVDCWNSKDIDRIMTHYAPDITFRSPLAAQLTGSGIVQGTAALRAYWTQGLARNPDLKFHLVEVFCGHDCLTILYENHRNQSVTETVEFGENGKVTHSAACYRDKAAP